MVAIQASLSGAFTVFVPILPLFLPELGVTATHDIALWAGWLNGITSLVAVFTAPLWGRLADRWSRKRIIVLCTLGMAVCAALVGLVHGPWSLLLLRGGFGLFSGFAPAGIARIADRAPPHRLGYALGWLATGTVVGTLFGPLIGGLVASVSGYRSTFLLTAVLLAGVALLAQLVLTAPIARDPARPAPAPSSGLRAVLSTPGVAGLIALLFVVQLSLRAPQPIITLVVQQRDVGGQALALLAGLAFSLVGVGDVLASPFLGRRSDVLGYRRVLLICMGGAALATAAQGLSHTLWPFLAARLALGMFIGGILPTANAMIGRAIRDGDRGGVYGLTTSATFFGGFAGPLAGGMIAASLGFDAVFLISGAALSLAAFWVWRVRRPA